MCSANKLTRSFPIVIMLVATVGMTDAENANAQFGPKILVPNNYYHQPIPVFQGPTITQYSPSTSSFYSVPMVAQPNVGAPVFFRPAPVVYSQRYSFYGAPRATIYNPGFPSYTPGFSSTNTYHSPDPLAPYISGSGVAPQTNPPYKTPLYFRN